MAQANTRGWVLTALRVAGSAVVLTLLFHFLPLAPLRDALRRVPLGLFALTVVAYLLTHAVAGSPQNPARNTWATPLCTFLDFTEHSSKM